MKTYTKPTFQELVNIFPSAKPLIRRGLKEKIKEYKKDLDKALTLEREFNNEILSQVKYDNQWFWAMVRDVVIVSQWRDGRETKIRRNNYYLSSMDSKNPPKAHKNSVTDDDIVQAKQTPLETFYGDQLRRVGTRATGKCPFHNEKTGSFTIYTDQNTYHCFGCSENGDVIDFVMKINDLNFVEAVKLITNK